MGKILNGILGGVSGKVSGVVGSSWKGINYIRGYAIPANPQTPAQQAQRNKMTFLVSTARAVLDSVLNVFWTPIATQMSGFNLFLQKNLKLITGVDDYENIIMSTGNLTPITVNRATYDSSDGTITSEYNTPTPNPYENTVDHINVVFIHKPTGTAWYFQAPIASGGDSVGGTIDTGLTPTDIVSYTFASKGSGSDVETCTSVYKECETP